MPLSCVASGLADIFRCFALQVFGGNSLLLGFLLLLVFAFIFVVFRNPLAFVLPASLLLIYTLAIPMGIDFFRGLLVLVIIAGGGVFVLGIYSAINR